MRKFLATTVLSLLAVSSSLSAVERPQEEETKGPVVRPAMHQDMARALNDQFALELESSYLYLGMATYFAEQGLDGFAQWFRVQAEEENEHAMKVYQFMLERGVEIQLPPLGAPSTSYASPIEALEVGLSHEIHVSQVIKSEYALSQELEEYDAGEFVLWFLREQVEEENLFQGVLGRLYLISDAHPAALLLLDRDMGERASFGSCGCGC